MKFEYTEELRKYMEKKGRSDVLLYTISPAGCCGGAPELIVELLKSKDVEEAAAKPGRRLVQGELGSIVIENMLVPLEEDATITLGLTRFLGLPDITATGIRQLA